MFRAVAACPGMEGTRPPRVAVPRPGSVTTSCARRIQRMQPCRAAGKGFGGVVAKPPPPGVMPRGVCVRAALPSSNLSYLGRAWLASHVPRGPEALMITGGLQYKKICELCLQQRSRGLRPSHWTWQSGSCSRACAHAAPAAITWCAAAARALFWMESRTRNATDGPQRQKFGSWCTGAILQRSNG